MENYSPLRYPGGKSALYPAIANIIESNNMKHCIYIEPFAGGANIAWSLLINGIVDYITGYFADDAVGKMSEVATALFGSGNKTVSSSKTDTSSGEK